MQTRDLVRTALMVALCVAVGYAVKLMVALPNVELISAAVFTCGVLEGVRRGAAVGLLAAALYFGLNPYGVSPPPVYAASILGLAAMGAGGGVLRAPLPRLPRAAQALVAGASGFLLTLFYDVLTNLSVWLLVRESASPAAVLAGGLSFPFPLAHALGNMFGCALLAPAVSREVRRRVLLVALVLLAAAPAAGQVSPLVPDAAAPDLVLERSDWLALEPLSLEELLRRVAGVVVSPSGGLGSFEFLNIAGSGPGRVRLVVDGLDVDEPELEWPRLYALPVSMLARLELYRSTDPVRIEIWLREVEADAPQSDFDLGRGSLVTRTRRVQFFTPRGAVTAGLGYEELLRGQDDFRSRPGGPAPDDLGSYDGRGVLLRLDLRRPDGEHLRLQHQRFADDAHGSARFMADFASAGVARNVLRWERTVGKARVVLDLSNQTWRRRRALAGDVQEVSEARTRAALDLGLPGHGAWQGWLRLRAAELAGERTIAAVLQRRVEERYDVEGEARRDGPLATGVWLGAHRHARLGTTWSARWTAALERGVWRAEAQAGRGVSFAGYGEEAETRPGAYAAAGLGRRTERLRVHLLAYGKRLEGGTSARLFFPDLGGGPQRLAGLLSEADAGPLRLALAWTPYVRGDPGGLPRLQTWLQGRLSRSFFAGDLEGSLLAAWKLETRRDFAPGVSLPRYGAGEVALDLHFLQRADFFWSVRNVADTRYEMGPGVRPPGRQSFFGVRLRLLD